MGHTQFIPTSYLDYAVDFTGDGKRDIWSDTPTDALASTAAYLKAFGWVTGQPWGIEVVLPRGFDFTLANRKIQKSPREWADLGVRATDGRPIKDHGVASILLPAGGTGAAFMIFKNFSVLERYNTADAYVIGVGHLSDRLKGGEKIKGSWPRGDRALTFTERKELQERLTRARVQHRRNRWSNWSQDHRCRARLSKRKGPHARWVCIVVSSGEAPLKLTHRTSRTKPR